MLRHRQCCVYKQTLLSKQVWMGYIVQMKHSIEAITHSNPYSTATYPTHSHHAHPQATCRKGNSTLSLMQMQVGS